MTRQEIFQCGNLLLDQAQVEEVAQDSLEARVCVCVSV